MNIIERVKSFEDACKELNLNPENLPVVDMLPEKDRKSIVAYYKLVIIIRALNEGWEPDWEDCNQLKYWNYLHKDFAGLAYAITYNTASSATYYGSLLCFKSYPTAQFAIANFRSLYEDYLLIK